LDLDIWILDFALLLDKQELKSYKWCMNTDDFSKLLDEKLEPLATNLDEITSSVETIEENQIEPIDLVRIRQSVRKMEKRVTSIDGKLAKTASKSDLKKLTTKKDLKKLDKKFDRFILQLDEIGSNTAQRVRHIERHTNIPPFKPVVAN
jgi:pyruvate/2-oxoglutarate/acetoin dehydrogenase E1 component